jgi:5-methylcytosine-specific restriction endonuclease McrA
LVIGGCLKKYFTILFPLIILFFWNNSLAQRGGHHSYSPTFHTPKISSNTYHYSSPKSTYKSGSTTYISGEQYKSSGLPKVDRSTSEKKKFLKSQGYTKTPNGYEVDHIQPLSKGGQDNPSNMQLLTKQQHKQKTASERKK